VIGSVVETPCTIAEILNAGWVYKCEEIYARAAENLHMLDNTMESTFQSDVLTLDDLLRNSIETARLHSLFLEE
jgi:hypothetical protein